MDADEIPDGVEIDTQRLEQLLSTLRRQADDVYSLWSEIWAERERTARFYGQDFEPEPIDELDGLVLDLHQTAEAAYDLLSEATSAYWSRQRDDFDEDEEDEEDDEDDE